MSDAHSLETPSPWVARFAAMIRAPASPQTVLDLACGSGRHTRLLAALGHVVLAVDVDLSRLGSAASLPGVSTLQADLEHAPWPFAGRQFAGIVVANYLHRPLLPLLVTALAPGGVLIYETFARGNERFGKPSNPDFLLLPGELLQVAQGQTRVVAYEDVIVSEPKAAAVQRICAIRLC